MQPGKAADGKLLPGDRVVSIDGHEVISYPEVQAIVARNAGKPLRIVVQRDGQPVADPRHLVPC